MNLRSCLFAKYDNSTPRVLFNATLYGNLICSYRSLNAYGLSKLANILHANELARLLKVILVS